MQIPCVRCRINVNVSEPYSDNFCFNSKTLWGMFVVIYGCQPYPCAVLHDTALIRSTKIYSILSSYLNPYGGFARQPCCIAGTIDHFSYGKKKFCSYAKYFHCSCHATWLLCKTSIILTLPFTILNDYSCYTEIFGASLDLLCWNCKYFNPFKYIFKNSLIIHEPNSLSKLR